MRKVGVMNFANTHEARASIDLVTPSQAWRQFEISFGMLAFAALTVVAFVACHACAGCVAAAASQSADTAFAGALSFGP